MARFHVIDPDGNVVNVIQLDRDCVVVTQAEADAMPHEHFVHGWFYILPDGSALGAELPPRVEPDFND